MLFVGDCCYFVVCWCVFIYMCVWCAIVVDWLLYVVCCVLSNVCWLVVGCCLLVCWFVGLLVCWFVGLLVVMCCVICCCLCVDGCGLFVVSVVVVCGLSFDAWWLALGVFSFFCFFLNRSLSLVFGCWL